MSIVVTQSVLTGLQVKEAMRRHVVRVSKATAIGNAINYFIKHKVNSVLTIDEKGDPAGVVSKTDIMGAYYAALPLDTPLEMIMAAPPLYCHPDDPLTESLEEMRRRRIYRLYVHEAGDGQVVGALAYPDIVGLLHRYCYSCDRSLHQRSRDTDKRGAVHLRVRDVMTPSVTTFLANDSLLTIMEGLSMYRFGAVLITDENQTPRGVVSKTDLVLAYKHGLSSDKTAAEIMGTPIRACPSNAYLEDAIRQMIFAEIQRLFVSDPDTNQMVGVLSLSDAARLRSGSCQACVSSRIKVEENS